MTDDDTRDHEEREEKDFPGDAAVAKEGEDELPPGEDPLAGDPLVDEEEEEEGGWGVDAEEDE